MILNTATVKSSADDINISILTIAPDNGAKAIVQFVHGMCEHKERYIPIMEYLAEKGYACVIHDHRGHGASVRSSEDLGYFYEGGFKAMIDDTHLVTLWAKSQYEGLKLFLFGHSMGSMVVRSYAKRYDDQLSGLVICGSPSKNPAAGIGKAISALAVKTRGDRHRSKTIQKLAVGSFNHNFIDAVSVNSWICSDPEIVTAYDNNPLCNYQFTNNGFYNLFSLMQDAYQAKGWKMGNRNMPIKFIAGEDDPCIGNIRKFHKAVDFMKKAGYVNVKAQTYTGLRHEILNEKGKEKVWKDLYETLESWL